MGGAASRGKKPAAEQRDAGLKPQGQAARKDDSAALLPSHPAPPATPSGLQGSGRPAAKPWGDKPATAQELASAGVCARRPLSCMLVAFGQCEVSWDRRQKAPQMMHRCVDSLPTSRVSQTDTSKCWSGRAARKPWARYTSFGPVVGRNILSCDQHQG